MRKRQVDSEFVANNNNSDLGSPKVREERIQSPVESVSIATLFPAFNSDTETDASSESSQTPPRFSYSIPSFFPPARSSSESSVNSEIIPTDPLLPTFKGKFSWPSGATYEGEFKSGQMEGLDTYPDSNGDTYRGSWSSNQKHGYGQRYKANGDFYDGFWKRNMQDGQGRYIWNNGNQYIGEWKNGLISGRGVWIWANGNRYYGVWEDGFPRGNGVFSWPDGSRYVGSWIKKGKIQQMKGTFYPVNGNNDDENSMIRTRKRNIPRICIWESGEWDVTFDLLIYNVKASQNCLFKIFFLVAQTKIIRKIISARTRRRIQTARFKELVDFVDRKEAEIKEILRQKSRDSLDGQSDSLSFSSL